jgi:hypothetical protein
VFTASSLTEVSDIQIMSDNLFICRERGSKAFINLQITIISHFYVLFCFMYLYFNFLYYG